MKRIFQLATAALFCACTEIETLEFVKSENSIEEMESNPTQSQSALHSECVTYRRPINFFYTGSTQENINIRIELNTKDLIDNNTKFPGVFLRQVLLICTNKLRYSGTLCIFYKSLRTNFLCSLSQNPLFLLFFGLYRRL